MAEVAGPGQFSKRTDKAVAQANRSLPDAGYGEQAAYQAQEGGAKMATQPDVSGMNFNDLFGSAADRGHARSTVRPRSRMSLSPLVRRQALGRVRRALNLPDQQSEDLQKLQNWMPVLEFMANQPGASWAMRNVIRQVKGKQ